MTKTETLSFGTGRREGHDSSAFYNRRLYEGVVGEPASLDELLHVHVPEPGEWADRVYCHTSEDMSVIPDNSVALAFTSPPYNVGKDYDDDMGLEAYLGFVRTVAQEVYRVLRPGGRYVINVANLGRKPYIPLHACFYDVHMAVGFLPMGEIIWQKARGASGSCAWGSWLSAKAPCLRDVHEYLLVFAKQSFSRPDSGVSDIGRDEFMNSTLSVWEISAESAKRVGHPAPFPIELAEGVIKLYSFVGDVVLDPFVGSGTTCVAAALNDRHYVGFDIVCEYCDLAVASIAEAKAARDSWGSPTRRRRTPMARVKTETTELALAFGILGVEDPLSLSHEDTAARFQGSLSQAKYARFREEFATSRHQRLYQKLHSVGMALRQQYPFFRDVAGLEWCGPQSQAKTTTASIDLIVANTAVSVKAGSNVVGNPSPYNLFISLPRGSAKAQDTENWYLQHALSEYQGLYDIVLSTGPENLPADVAEFEETAKKHHRRMVQNAIKQFPDEQAERFQQQYLAMCHEVATKSAELFNRGIEKSLQGRTRSAVLEDIARRFFRIDAMEYILAGTESRKPFAVVVPQLTKWKQNWTIERVEAVPDLQRKQSVVDISVHYRSRADGRIGTARFHVEIRWSHGKFCGNPEAKLYKNFSWQNVGFFVPVL